jgi:hypothetical protein
MWFIKWYLIIKPLISESESRSIGSLQLAAASLVAIPKITAVIDLFSSCYLWFLCSRPKDEKSLQPLPSRIRISYLDRMLGYRAGGSQTGDFNIGPVYHLCPILTFCRRRNCVRA